MAAKGIKKAVTRRKRGQGTKRKMRRVKGIR
jgi:hypothetical protein